MCDVKDGARAEFIRPSWVELQSLKRARALLLLPCNAAACVEDYFCAEVYRASSWHIWREADAHLRDLRRLGRVALAGVDSSILETAPEDLVYQKCIIGKPVRHSEETTSHD